MCCHPATRLELIDVSFGSVITEEGSSNGYIVDLHRGNRTIVAHVRCPICNAKFELQKVDPFESGDWSKLSPGTYQRVHRID